MKRLVAILICSFMFAVCVVSAYCDTTIVSASGTPVSTDTLDYQPVTGAYPSVNGDAVSAWSQTTSFNNVSISAVLDGGLNAYSEAFSGQAVLIIQVGSGTTIADQVAVANYSVSAGTDGYVMLSTGLDLAAGSYFLTLDATSGAGAWDGLAIPGIVSTAPGATYLGWKGTQITDLSVFKIEPCSRRTYARLK
jgi:hypothetical protein